jgi:signal peptidase I
MANTLHKGQKVRMTIAGRGYRPRAGDIVEFTFPSEWGGGSFKAISRVIATGGETIRAIEDKVQVSTDHGATYQTLHEPYVFMDGPDIVDSFGPVTVPRGRLWLMGDHRNDSLDSRYPCDPDTLEGGTAPCSAIDSTVPNSAVVAYVRP